MLRGQAVRQEKSTQSKRVVAIKRSRNAQATKADILRAARTTFAESGYDSVGVREIASLAGVNAALIIRYFGSKEELFEQAVTEAFNLNDLLAVNRKELGSLLTHYILQKREKEGSLEPLLALLRSASSEQGSRLMRRLLDEQFIRPLAKWLGGKQAELRASLIASTMLGLALTRDVLKSERLEGSEIEPIIKLVAPVLQNYVDG
jgi:AcrR family transcriptional regulator